MPYWIDLWSTMASAASSPSFVTGGSSTSAITAATVTGSHVLRINGYSETLGRPTGSYISSSKFLAAGHTWYIRYYPHGYDEEAGDCMSLFLVLDGSNSATVQFTFGLLDPEGNQVYRKISRCPVALHESRSAMGFPRFIRREYFERSKYLQDNCFRIVCGITVVSGFCREASRSFFAAPVPPSDLHQDLGRLLASGKGADVKFRVRDKVFLAHRNVVAARSVAEPAVWRA